MVLTRSGRNRLLSRDTSISTDNQMPNVTAVETVPTATAPAVTNTNIQDRISTTATITPVVQQFLNMASGSNSGGGRSGMNTTITTPEYSDITTRNTVQQIRQETREPQPSQYNGTGPSGDVVDSLRSEFSRQLQEFQRSLQDIARTLSQHMAQTTNLNQNVPARAQTEPWQPRTTAAEFNGHHSHGSPNGLYTQHFRPVREPQYAQGFGRNSSPIDARHEYHHPHAAKVDLSKWGIKFDGTLKSMSAEDFIFRLNILCRDYGCSFNDILRSFHLLLENQALEWYWNLRKLTTIRNWQDLETAFLTQFRRYENEFQIQKKIMDRRQAPQESFEDFFEAIIRLRNQQRTPYTEKDLIEIMKSNLKPALSHLLFSVKIEGLNEFCQQAKRAESLLASQRQQHMQRSYVPQRISELDYGGDTVADSDRELDALKVNNHYTCWNCRQIGHSFVDCPVTPRRIFCFKCGRDGVVTPKCPKCQGNLSLNRPLTGETRSTQT